MKEKYLITSLGSIGRRHLQNLRKLRPEATIAVLRLTSKENVDGTSADADMVFTSLDEALSFGPRAAIIASPATEHLRLATALVMRDVHVLVEKPLANTTEGLADLIALAERRRLTFAVGYNFRLQPSLMRVHELIREGAIGKVMSVRAEVGQYLPDWRPGTRYQDGVSAKKSLGGGALLELSHELDYLYWMFGMPDEITARGGKLSDLEIDVEDMVEICLEYVNSRRLINVHVDFLQRVPHRTCRFIGSEGTLVWDALANCINLYQVAAGEWKTLEFPSGARNQVYLDEIDAFLGAIEGKPCRLAQSKDAYDVLAIVEAAKLSMSVGRTIYLNANEK